MANKPEIQRALVLSTAHITREDNARLWAGAYPSACLHWEYGHWLWVSEDAFNMEAALRDKDFSSALHACLKAAAAHDCAWLRLDADGSMLDGLQTFEW